VTQNPAPALREGRRRFCLTLFGLPLVGAALPSARAAVGQERRYTIAFANLTEEPGVTFEETIENIDIGGPSMIRAAAKNFQDVAVVTSPDDYEDVLAKLSAGGGILDRETLFGLARKAFLVTARYDSQIAQHLSRLESSSTPAQFPGNLFMDFEKISDLRYGENPHQKAAFYRWGGRRPFGLAASRQLQGKELSYNNIVDVEAALELVREFEEPACCVIKHTNPCGTASAATLKEAYVKAYEADSVSAFGSVIGFNRKVDAATANELSKLFVEAVVAPEFDAEALSILSGKKNLRLLAVESFGSDAHTGSIGSDAITRPARCRTGAKPLAPAARREWPGVRRRRSNRRDI